MCDASTTFHALNDNDDGHGDEPTTERSDDTPLRKGRRKLVLRAVLPGDDASWELVGERWTLGRARSDTLRLERSGVSREHAAVERRGPVYSIRDLGSTNGTYLDGARVEHASLRAGAVLRLGEWLGIVEEHDADEPGPYHFSELGPGVWGGALLRSALRPLRSACGARVPVVLVGRTGAGKERFARAAHAFATPALPFHAVNCAALPPTLAEAELFGYRKGAFTGAERCHEGHLRAAGRGTLFLDEIADLSLPLQAKLLRALDTGELAALGETKELRFEARVIAACQQPLGDLVAQGTFREDLAARLGGVTVVLPELRARRGDVPSLFASFLRWHSAGTAPLVSTRLQERLCLHAWPANVRELELLARHLLAVHGLEPVLRRSHLPAALRDTRAIGSAESSAKPRGDTVQLLAAALRSANGNVREAAREVGITRQLAYRLINTSGLGRADGGVGLGTLAGGEDGRPE